MRYTDANKRDTTSEIEFLEEYGGVQNVEDNSADSTEKGNPRKISAKTKKAVKTVDDNSSEFYFVNLKLSKQLRRRIRIYSDLEQISIGEFYADAINKKLESLAEKYVDNKELKSILIG